MSFFSDLDSKKPKNSFFSDLDQEKPSFFSDLDQEKKKSFFSDLEESKAKDAFDPKKPPYTFNVQPTYSDYQTPDQAALSREKAGEQLLGGALEGASLSALDILPPDEGDTTAERQRTIGRLGGLILPIGLIHKVFAPLGFWGRFAGAATAGASVEAGKQYFKDEEIDGGEIAKEAAIWTGLEGAILLPQMIATISKLSGQSYPQVMKFLWDKVKGSIKNPFKKTPTAQDIEAGKVEISPEVENALNKEAESAIKDLEEGKDIAKKDKSIVKPANNADSISDVDLFQNLKFIARDGLWDPLERTQAQWIVDEMEKLGNDPDKIQSVIERMPTQWKQEGDLYVPAKTMDLQEETSPKSVEPKDQELETKKEKPKKLPKVNEDSPTKQNDFSKPTLKKQKDFIIDKIDDALVNPKKQDKIVIKVPQDGIFKVNNTPTALKTAKARVEKNWPVTPLKPGKGEPLKNTEVVGPSKPPKEKSAKPLSRKGARTPPKETANRKPVMGKEQAAKRSDILKLFRKAFKDPIRLGKFKQRALGIHKMWPKVTRLLHDNDIETAAHEIGHNLHTTLYGGNATGHAQQQANVINALRPYFDELKQLAHYEPYTLEGFAEFTRMYVTNPEVAEKLAPKFYRKFEADLEAQYPELKNALLEARDYYEKYLQGTPESRIDAQTDYAEDQSKLNNLTDWVKKPHKLDNLKTKFLDDIFPAKRLVAEAFGIPLSEVENLKDPRNLYRSLRVLKGAIGKADVFTMFETFDVNTLKRTGNGLKQILQQLPDDKSYREFNRYLLARRAIEKAEQNILTGINLGDAVAVEAKYREKYEKIAQELDQYNDALLKYARDSGLLSKNQYADIKKNNLMYVPFQRVMEKEKGGRASSSGKLQASKPIKRMKGSTRDIVAPIESVIKNTYSIIMNSEKNRSAQVLAELATMKDMASYVEHVPVPTELKDKITRDELEKSVIKHLKETGQSEFLEMEAQGDSIKFVLREDLKDLLPDIISKFGATSYPAGENIITVYRDGKPQYYEVSPEIYEMWNKGTTPYVANLLVRILSIPARTLRAGAILNPKFMQKNLVRDTWGGILFTKYGKSIRDPAGLLVDTLFEPLAMLSVAAKQGPIYVEWLKSGGGMSTMQSLDRQSVYKKLKEVRHGYSPLQVMKWLRKVAEISEESNRLAEFGRALSVEGDTRLGREIAAFASRDLSIDFAKIGILTKALNQIIPFYNATIQGTDKLVRTGFSKDDRKEFLARVIGAVVIPALMFAWLNKDDERVQEFQEQEKDFNFITFIGDVALKIPVPFETGVIANGLVQRMFTFMMTKDPDAFNGFMGSIASAMLPNFIPALANPFIEVEANKNFFTGGRIIPASKEKLISKYQYNTYTSTTARLLGRAMSYMIGEDTRSKAASPAIIDHFINSWTGGLGRLVVSILDTALEGLGLGDKIPKPSQSITERLGLNAFSARYPRSNTSSIEKFYDNYQDATARRKSADYGKKMDLETPEGIDKAYQRIDRLYDYNTLNQGYKAIQQCQKAINNIYNDPELDGDLKKQMIDDLYLQMIDFAKAANEDIKKYRLSQK